MGVAAVLTGAALLVTAYAEHPPWAPDIAYEAGYVKAKRIRGYDLHGDLVPALLAGGCAREAQDTEENPKAGHDPQRWTRGCLDGAAGRPSRHQGLAY